MTVQLATGNTDRAVTSASDRRLYAAMQGTECYVHQIGKMCAASLDGPNKLVVENGSLSINGAHVDLLGNTEFTIPSGLQGKKRATICGIYYKAEADGSEDAIEKTYTGDPVESGEVPDPEYPDGNILDNGTTETFMPLYRVVTDGINVLEPVPMYKVLASAAEMQKRWDSLSQDTGFIESEQNGISFKVRKIGKLCFFQCASGGRATVSAASDYSYVLQVPEEFVPSIETRLASDASGGTASVCAFINADGWLRVFASQTTKYWTANGMYFVD